MSYSPCDFSDDVLGVLQDMGALTDRDLSRLAKESEFTYLHGEIACKAIKRLGRLAHAQPQPATKGE